MNRPVDVCALCDRAIDLTERTRDYHRYLGPGWVHGGGRESIAVHISCANAGTGSMSYRIPGWVPAADYDYWLAEWTARLGRYDPEFLHTEHHARYDGTGVECHREPCRINLRAALVPGHDHEGGK